MTAPSMGGTRHPCRQDDFCGLLGNDRCRRSAGRAASAIAFRIECSGRLRNGSGRGTREARQQMGKEALAGLPMADQAAQGHMRGTMRMLVRSERRIDHGGGAGRRNRNGHQIPSHEQACTDLMSVARADDVWHEGRECSRHIPARLQTGTYGCYGIWRRSRSTDSSSRSRTDHQKT